MPASKRVQQERQDRYESRMARAAEVVPPGMYCYAQTGPFEERALADGSTVLAMPTRTCPHWKLNGNKREQQNGYCRLMKKGDWMGLGPWLLWDQVKECGINVDGTVIVDGIEMEIGTFDPFAQKEDAA
jgi:hypothetical protein